MVRKQFSGYNNLQLLAHIYQLQNIKWNNENVHIDKWGNVILNYQKCNTDLRAA